MNHEPRPANPTTKALRWAFVLPLFICAIAVPAWSVYKSNLDVNGRTNRAKYDIMILDRLCLEYSAEAGYWPESLQIFTGPDPKGRRPKLLSDTELLDPWGRSYQYDPTKLNPRTNRPLIWTEGPEPGQPGSRIANWE